MRTWLCLVFLCALTSNALAQTGYFQGITPRPADAYAFPASLTVTRSAPAGGAGTLVPALYTHVTTDAEARSLEWANLTILNNHSGYGSNVAVYGQTQAAWSNATCRRILAVCFCASGETSRSGAAAP